MIDWDNHKCAECGTPMVRESTPYGDGWRLDCPCHDVTMPPDQT